MSERAIRETTHPTVPVEDCLRTHVEWHQTGDAVEPWRAQVGLNHWTIRVNDFPEERLYTLLIDGRTVDAFDDWPREWTVVSAPAR